MIVGIPVGGSTAHRCVPTSVGGVGLIRSNVQDAAQLFNVTSKNDFGFDVGGGVMGFFSQNVGLRGDVRYFRSFQGSEPTTSTGLALVELQVLARHRSGVAFKF